MRTPILILLCAASAFMAGAGRAANEQPILRTGTKPAEFVMTKITVSNLRKSYDFYTKTLGLKEIQIAALPKPAIDNPDVAFTEVALNYSGSLADAHLVLVKQKGRMPAPDSARLTWIGLKVTDIRAVVKQVEAAGLPVEVQPKPVYGLLVAAVRDPDGYLVELLEGQSFEQ
jgi:catechol 2,3-dioxygenase-like lactoylglutathione lyase family enzyme